MNLDLRVERQPEAKSGAAREIVALDFGRR
jgi:hypothetical protein